MSILGIFEPSADQPLQSFVTSDDTLMSRSDGRETVEKPYWLVDKLDDYEVFSALIYDIKSNMPTPETSSLQNLC